MIIVYMITRETRESQGRIMNKRRMNQRLRRRTDLDKGLLDKGWHSKAYHRHFEGYTELEETDEKGKTVIKRVYVGDYHRLDLPKKKRVLLRFGYAALIVLTAMLFWSAASRPVSANSTWYLAVVQMVGVCLIGLMGVNLLSHCTAPRDMTVGDWKASSGKLKRNSKFTALVMELLALLTLLHLLLNGESWGIHLLCVALYAAAGLAALVLNRLEVNAPYLTYPSTEEAPADGSYIDV